MSSKAITCIAWSGPAGAPWVKLSPQNTSEPDIFVSASPVNDFIPQTLSQRLIVLLEPAVVRKVAAVAFDHRKKNAAGVYTGRSVVHRAQRNRKMYHVSCSGPCRC